MQIRVYSNKMQIFHRIASVRHYPITSISTQQVKFFFIKTYWKHENLLCGRSNFIINQSFVWGAGPWDVLIVRHLVLYCRVHYYVLKIFLNITNQPIKLFKNLTRCRISEYSSIFSSGLRLHAKYQFIIILYILFVSTTFFNSVRNCW